ncbi:hypothetical protein [Miltoncostaea oceani]|nr:hypothetical protein [Miltoncostaea oceani]
MVLVLLAIAAFLAAVGRDDPPGPSTGQRLNNYTYNEAVREARLRRLQRW